MVDLTQKTLGTVDRLEKYRGHLMNWYDTRTLNPKPPYFVSSVDSGNMVASLWTLRQGCHDCLRRPLFTPSVAQGLADHLRVLVELHALPKRGLGRFEAQVERGEWLAAVLNFPDAQLERDAKKSVKDAERSNQIAWFLTQARARIEAVRDLTRKYLPWTLPEFSEVSETGLGASFD